MIEISGHWYSTVLKNYIFQIPRYLFLCLSNLNPATTEETLTNFVEAGLGNDDADIEEVVYSEDRTIAVVQLSSPVGKLQTLKRATAPHKHYTI